MLLTATNELVVEVRKVYKEEANAVVRWRLAPPR